MVFKQTHTSSDGQERSCHAAPGNCPLSSSKGSNPNHVYTIDGEQLSKKTANQLYYLTKAFTSFLGENERSSYPKLVNSLISHYLPNMDDPMFDDSNPWPGEVHELPALKEYESYIMDGSPRELALQLAFSRSLVDVETDPASTAVSLCETLHLISRNPEFVTHYQSLYGPPMSDILKTDDGFSISGYFHRPWKQGPAYILEDGSEYYYAYNKRHRPVEHGPAVVVFGGASNGGWELYYENGLIHRPAHLGPAFTEGKGFSRECKYWEFGRQLTREDLRQRGVRPVWGTKYPAE